MGWIWRIFGAVIGAFVAVVYAPVATIILFLSAHAVMRSVGGEFLLTLLYDSVGTAVAGYIAMDSCSKRRFKVRIEWKRPAAFVSFVSHALQIS